MAILWFVRSAVTALASSSMRTRGLDYIGQRGTGMMFAPGMMFTIEPMINEGTEEVFVDGDDDWSVYTKDGKASASGRFRCW